MSTTALQPIREDAVSANAIPTPDRAPAFPWKDPFAVPPEKLGELIVSLQNACAQDSANAALHTLLGMAQAMNYDVYEAMDALEAARRIAPQNFFAQFKLSELFFRLRLMERAEMETHRAMELANSASEISLVRKQLSEIRRLKREGVERTAWTKSIRASVVGIIFIVLMILVFYMG